MFVILIAVIITGAFLFFNKASAPTVTNNEIIFYYGQECPHCVKVEEFIKNNNVDAKIKITKKEVWHNQTNATEMIGIANKCGIPTNSVGVPLLWDGAKCYTGDTDIINWLAGKL